MLNLSGPQQPHLQNGANRTTQCVVVIKLAAQLTHNPRQGLAYDMPLVFPSFHLLSPSETHLPATLTVTAFG